MLAQDETPVVQTDAYIDMLIARHAGLPVALPAKQLPPPAVRQVIELLERGLPRFHPSFAFEERLATDLLAAAEPGAAARRPMADVIRLPVQVGALSVPAATIDRRLLLTGAIASGFSVAGAAAMVAWLRGRGRPSWLT
jgi:hypothetical protein